MSHPDKKRWPLEEAETVARAVCAALEPVTARLIVAGSIRRRKPLVGDIEILYIPRIEAVADAGVDLFEPTPVNLAEELLNRMVVNGWLGKRPNVNGGTSWGPQIKLAIHRASGIPVDLFAATEENWWNYLVCRTGPAESNMSIAHAAIARGWKWRPYTPGFAYSSVGDGDDELRPMRSEREVFEFVGLPYREPHERK